LRLNPGGRSLHLREYWSALVLDEEREKLGRLGLAGIVANDMNVIGTLIERLSRSQSDRLSAFELHHDSTFEYVDKRVSVVLMDGVRAARRIHDFEHHTFFATASRYILRHKLRDLCLLGHEGAGHQA